MVFCNFLLCHLVYHVWIFASRISAYPDKWLGLVLRVIVGVRGEFVRGPQGADVPMVFWFFGGRS